MIKAIYLRNSCFYTGEDGPYKTHRDERMRENGLQNWKDRKEKKLSSKHWKVTWCGFVGSLSLACLFIHLGALSEQDTVGPEGKW